MPHIGAPHIPESLGSTDGGLSVVRDRGNGPKARPAVYRWTSGAGWAHMRPPAMML